MSAADVFGRLVRNERKKLGLSQEDLADQCDLHRNAIGLLERGERTPNLETIVAIASGLRIRPSRLIAKFEKDMAAN